MLVAAGFSLACGTPGPGGAAAAAPDGAKLYERCASCHLPDGHGVDGVFPPLGAGFVSLAATPAGRAYLVLLVTHGIHGPLEIDGVRYAGAMYKQRLDDAETAAVLNYVIEGLNGGGAEAFDALEVRRIRAAHPDVRANQLPALRPATGPARERVDGEGTG